MAGKALLLLALVCASASVANAVFASTNGSISVTYAQANGNAPAGSADLPMTVLSRSVVGKRSHVLH